MDVIVFYKNLDAIEQSAVNSFFAILRNLLEHKLLNSSDFEKTSFLGRLEKVNSTEDSIKIFQETEKFFIDSKYPQKKDILGKKIKPPLVGLFEFFRKNSLNLFHDFLKSVISNTSEAIIPEDEAELIKFYQFLRNNFIVALSVRDDVEKVLKDYWFYVDLQLLSAKKKFLDENIFVNFLNRIKFKTFEKLCFDKIKIFLNEFILNHRKEMFIAKKQSSTNLVDDEELDSSVSSTIISKFEMSLLELKKTGLLESSAKNFKFDECLQVLGCETRDLEPINMSTKTRKRKIRKLLKCPIEFSPLEEPTLTPDGHTYNRKALERWLALGHDTDPMTKNYLSLYMLKDNRAIMTLQLGLHSENHEKIINMSNSSQDDDFDSDQSSVVAMPAARPFGGASMR